MHPTQHSTIKRRFIPSILNTHSLITKGVSKEAADAFIEIAASNLQSLGKPKLHIAPPRRGLQELLSSASTQLKSQMPINRNTQPAA